MDSPNYVLTYYVISSVWNTLRVERYILSHSTGYRRMSRDVLRQSLGRDNTPEPIYRLKLTLVATTLYSLGHRRTAEDVVRTLVSGGRFPLRPIVGVREWNEEDQNISNAAL